MTRKLYNYSLVSSEGSTLQAALQNKKLSQIHNWLTLTRMIKKQLNSWAIYAELILLSSSISVINLYNGKLIVYRIQYSCRSKSDQVSSTWWTKSGLDL